MSKGLKISSKLKDHILSESLKTDCNISDLAKSHGITSKTIYNWRRAYYLTTTGKATTKVQTPQTQADEAKSQTESSRSVQNKSNDFVELLVGNGDPRTNLYNEVNARNNTCHTSADTHSCAHFRAHTHNNIQTHALQRVSLLFGNLSLSFEGAIKSSSLFAIIKILEEESC